MVEIRLEKKNKEEKKKKKGPEKKTGTWENLTENDGKRMGIYQTPLRNSGREKGKHGAQPNAISNQLTREIGNW